MTGAPDSAIEAQVLVIGGGLAGGALACALAQAGLGVAVIDREPPARALEAAYDGRASALALASQRLLAAAGIWPAIAPEAEPILEIRVSEGSSPLFLHYDHRDVGADPFGFMAENRVIRAAVLARMGALEGIRHLAPATVGRLERGAGGVEARLADGRRVVARLAVGADGRASTTRGDAGIGVTRLDYGQTAIVCTVAHEHPHQGVAHERFLPAGPFAILPLKGRRSSIVWTETRELAPRLMALDDDSFLAELAERFGDFLGTLAVVGPRFAHPLALQLAHRTRATRLALVGDAAHAIHPIAGQGLNLGLRDVAALAEVVVDAHRLGLDVGSDSVLDGYARWRGLDSALMVAATDGLNRLFSNAVPPLKFARDVGLALVDRALPLKRLFMRHAMGLLGERPRLLDGRPL